MRDFAKIFKSMYYFIKKRDGLAHKIKSKKVKNNIDKNKRKSIEFFSKYTG